MRKVPFSLLTSLFWYLSCIFFFLFPPLYLEQFTSRDHSILQTWVSKPSTELNKEEVSYIYGDTHMHSMGYYRAIKKNKMLPFAAIWVDLDGIMLSQISQIERQILCNTTYM